MNEDIELVLESAKESMNKSLDHLRDELSKLRTGKADPSMLESVYVNYYGADTPLKQLANVGTPDAKTVTVKPWEKNMIGPVEKAIMNSDLGLNPQNNGEFIIINIPALTEERRKDLQKKSRKEGEEARISVRNARKEANDELKKLMNEEGLS
ncbi:MAG: ribosome recycling factor, partial [Flavobacteriales bacterium]